MTSTGPIFDASFQAQLHQLFAWRRDVRRFRRDPLPAGLVERLIAQACLAPSVGFSQPWRFVLVDEPARRAAMVANYQRANAAALNEQYGERRALYSQLKLAGLEQAPAHLAVFVDEATRVGHGLGRRSMPETVRYSAVAAVCQLWLAARAQGVGMGWVSIIDVPEATRALEVPASWTLIGYFCLGFPEEESVHPDLLRAGWETTASSGDVIVRR